VARAAEYGRVPTDRPASEGRRGSQRSILCCWFNQASDRRPPPDRCFRLVTAQHAASLGARAAGAGILSQISELDGSPRLVT